MSGRLKVVLWTTGNVATQAGHAVLARGDLELVGVYAFSGDKVGRDVAELIGLDEPTGVVATDDVSTLLALEPDCVVYAPLHPDVEHLTRILRCGINVVTTSEFMTGRVIGVEARELIEEAAVAGRASIFGSGMHPGFTQLLTGVVSGISLKVRHVAVNESVDVSLYAGDANFDAFGWGRPSGDSGHRAEVEAATLIFFEGVDVLAELMGVQSSDRRCTVEFAHATRDLDLPGRPIAAGTVAGIDVRWEALVDGHPLIELRSRWVMDRELDPAWQVDDAYTITIAGDPRVQMRLDVMPDTDDLGSLTLADIHGIGMRMTAAPVVNAIAQVCASEPGIRNYADLSTVAGHFG